MSQRNWKSSNTRHRGASSTASIGSGSTGMDKGNRSVRTSSSSSTMSISNRTVQTNPIDSASTSQSVDVTKRNGMNHPIINSTSSIFSEQSSAFPGQHSIIGESISPSVAQSTTTNSIFSLDPGATSVISESTSGSASQYDQSYGHTNNNIQFNSSDDYRNGSGVHSGGASVISGLSGTSSVDTYDFAFSSSNSVRKHGNQSSTRSRVGKSSSSFMSQMPTVEEIANNPDDNFLDSFLSLGDTEENGSPKRSSPSFNGVEGTFAKKKIYIAHSRQMVQQKLKQTMLFFQNMKTRFSTKVSSHNQPSQQQNFQLHTSKYTKQSSRSEFQKQLVNVFKFAIFTSLVVTCIMALRLANQNQPDLLDPNYGYQNQDMGLKQKLIRHNRNFGNRPINHQFISLPNTNPNPNQIDPMTMMALSDQNRVGGSGAVMPPQGLQFQNHPDHLASLQQYHKHIGVRIPAPFLNLADIDDLPVVRGRDLPFYWHIPRTGGTTMNDILGSCLKLNLATDAGGRNGHDHDEELQILNLGPIKYVNVDMSTPAGIERAKKLELASSNQADAMISSLVYEASLVFTPLNHGRLFTVLRHPIERAVSLFYYTQDMVWRRGNVKDLMDITIEEYFKGGMGENNWMTRFLANAKTKVLTDDDLNVAKEVLRRKCLVGLLSEKGESMSRFFRYFGWDNNVHGEEEQDCIDKKVDYAWPQKHRHEDVEEGTEVYDLIVNMNTFDLQLFEYAKVLFREQAHLF